MLGELGGSGYRVPPALARRADGQTLQLTPLLYLVLSAVDGRRTYDEIAAAVGPAVGRSVGADDVQHLVETRLRPLGVLQADDGSQPDVTKANPLLGLRFRYVVSDPAVTRRVTAPFTWLFNPVVVAVVLAGFVAVCAWVLFSKGLASATHQAFEHPALLLTVFALTVVSAGFHEFGHAAAARRGGATPGAMGTGLYLVWPAFYTDVTDSYRLGRGGRLRTDLGGLYFNAIVAVVMFGAWLVSGWDAILLIIATQVLQMVRQLAPLVRFDGYHVLADLTGVPDLYHRIKPTLLGMLPQRWGSPESKVLKPWARAVVTAWVVIVVPLLLGCLLLMVVALPRIIGTALASLERQRVMLGGQFADGDLLSVMVRLLSMVAIALPVLGVGYILVRVARQLVTGVWRGTRDKPGRRTVAAVTAAAVVAGLVWAWWPDAGTYRPIQAYERGTLGDVLPAVAGSRTPTGLEEGRGGTAQTIWPEGAELPSADSPELALVLVPREAAAADAETAVPTWVFPFNRPAPPEEGDNQALAVNTDDGSTLYDVAFALVWADGDRVLNTNEAYAFASCTDCRTVAVGFQVVLVLGQANVVVPQNLSGALNYNCIECVTYALATQLVLTLDGPLSEQGMADLAALWAEIAAFGASIEDVPLSELQSRLTEFERQILGIIQADPAVSQTGDAGAVPSADPSAATTASPSATGGGTPRSSSTGSATGGSSGSSTGNETSTPEPITSPSATASSEAPSPTSTSPSLTATTTP